jgi:hypothetical protein
MSLQTINDKNEIIIVTEDHSLIISAQQQASVVINPTGVQGLAGDIEDFKNSALKGYLRNNFKELIKTSAKISQIKVWTSSSKVTLLLTQDFIYTSGKLTQILYTNNRTSETMIKNINQINVNLTTITTL